MRKKIAVVDDNGDAFTVDSTDEGKPPATVDEMCADAGWEAIDGIHRWNGREWTPMRHKEAKDLS